MKKIFKTSILITLCLGLNLSDSLQANADINAVTGTWELDGYLDGNRNYADKKNSLGELKRYKIITPDHFFCFTINPSSKDIVRETLLGGGSASVLNGELVESNFFGSIKDIRLPARSKVRIEGGKLFQTMPNGLTEIYTRVSDGLINQTISDKSPTLGKQLIDLKEARDTGAITEGEYLSKKKKLLGQ